MNKCRRQMVINSSQSRASHVSRFFFVYSLEVWKETNTKPIINIRRTRCELFDQRAQQKKNVYMSVCLSLYDGIEHWIIKHMHHYHINTQFSAEPTLDEARSALHIFDGCVCFFFSFFFWSHADEVDTRLRAD